MLVGGYNARLRATGLSNRIGSGLIAPIDKTSSIRLKPLEKLSIVDQTVFHDFCVTGFNFSLR